MLYQEILLKQRGSKGDAKLCLYVQNRSEEIPYSKKRKMILICPGGGYELTSDREAEAVALEIMSMGYHAAVLRYSVAPAVYPAALLEVAASVKLIKESAGEWNVDPEQILIMGFSAGGHLAASYGVSWHEEWLRKEMETEKEMLRPAALILCYPVITAKETFWHRGSFENLLGERFGDEKLREELSLENRVTGETPKCFLWHTFEDPAVPVENSLLFVQALCRKKIPVEFHMYEHGGHGLSLAREVTDNVYGTARQKECRTWSGLLRRWIETL